MAMPWHLVPVNLSQSNNSETQAIGIDQAKKPLPRLPRGWSRACHESGLFLRKIGLGIVVTAFQGLFIKEFREPEKIAIHQNHVSALLGTLIHALPLGMAIFEVFLNGKGRYVGASFNIQNYLQFVAKTHEILMQASLATIVLSYIRYQISAGNGMPFGAVLCTLQSLQISYLWSVEFWSAILSKEFQLKKKIHFAFLTFVCITVATTAGPSSANLLIARQGIWPIKSLYLTINATFHDIWPDRFDAEDVPSNCKTMEYFSANYPPDCPLASMAGFLQGGPPLDLVDVFRDKTLDTINVIENVATISGDMIISPCGSVSEHQTCSTNPQKRFLAGLVQDSQIQVDRENSDNILEAYHSVKEDYFQPYAVASCVTDTVQNSSDQTPLRFARISEISSKTKNVREIVSIPSLKKSQISSRIPGNNGQFRVGWEDLPQDVFNTGVPGAIVIHPQSSNNSSYNITTCTLNAGWGSSTIMTDSLDRTEVHGHMSKLPDAWPIHRAFLDAYGFQMITAPDFGNISNFSYPQRHVSISRSWMESLNLNLIFEDNSTTSLMDQLLSRRSSPPGEHQIAFMLNFLLTPALSATGMKHDIKVFEDRANASEFCKTCLVFEMENSKYGWIYTTRETSTKLAIAVMLTYCCFVLAHVIYSAVSGVSSTAWDSVAELVVLAMNSSPTEILQNTCAGVVGRRAYGARVRVLKPSDKHLELVFGEVKDPNAGISKLVMNEKYGGIAVGKENEDEPMDVEAQGEIRKRSWVQKGQVSKD